MEKEREKLARLKADTEKEGRNQNEGVFINWLPLPRQSPTKKT